MVSADYVFLHGGGQGGWVWSEAIAALDVQTSGQFGRALPLDAPGCGAKRSRDVTNLSMADVATELIADIETAGFHDVVLVGHSQGGQAMPEMVRRRPDLFRRIIYVACAIPQQGQSLNDMMGVGRMAQTTKRSDGLSTRPSSV